MDALLKEISRINEDLKKPNEEEEEDGLSSKSIVPTLRKLPPKKNKEAKIKIDLLLYKLELDEDWD